MFDKKMFILLPCICVLSRYKSRRFSRINLGGFGTENRVGTALSFKRFFKCPLNMKSSNCSFLSRSCRLQFNTHFFDLTELESIGLYTLPMKKVTWKKLVNCTINFQLSSFTHQYLKKNMKVMPNSVNVHA